MPRKKEETVPEITIETLEEIALVIEPETPPVVEDIEPELEEVPVIKTVQKCECDGPVVIVRNRLGRIKVCKDCGLRK